MEGPAVPLASSLEHASLERLEKYLARHGLQCRVERAPEPSERFVLTVAAADADKAKRLFEDIALRGGDMSAADEWVELRCDENERNEIAAWLQLLLDEQDVEGSPIFFYRPQYEALLDALMAQGHAEVSVFLLRGLGPFLPEGPRRMVMSRALQEFFQLIESVAADEES